MQLASLAELAIALTGARERRDEMLLTGDAFVIAARAWPSDVYARLPAPCPYAVAVGAIAAAHGVALGDTLLGYLTAAVHSQVSVAVRLVPLGQTAGLQVMAALEPAIAALAEAATTAGLDSIGGIAYAAEIAQMRHETLEPRLFRS
jgi:urease accessory protein